MCVTRKNVVCLILFFVLFYAVVSKTQFTKTCNESDTQCRCANFISLTEPPYEENSMENVWCGRSPYQFRTSGRVLIIEYVYQESHDNPFEMNYIGESTY